MLQKDDLYSERSALHTCIALGPRLSPGFGLDYNMASVSMLGVGAAR